MFEDVKKPCEGAHDIEWIRGQRARCRVCGFDLRTLMVLLDYDPLEELERKLLEDWAHQQIQDEARAEIGRYPEDLPTDE